LPRIRAALARGELSIEAVIELCRFAGPEDDEALAAWAAASSIAQVKRRAEVACASAEDATTAHADRFVETGYADEGRRWWLHAELPAELGAAVDAALDAVCREIPTGVAGELDPDGPYARRADALVALCSFGPGKVRSTPTVVIHATEEAFAGRIGAEIEGGPAICPETLARLACDARLQVVTEDRTGEALRLGRRTRQPSRAQLRQLRWRDRGCVFAGCGHRRFVHAHHIRHWSKGGRTDLDNLALVCSFHHRLVHEHGWRLERRRTGGFRWFRPDGTRYRAGPAAA
jgi:hypothetical protein